MLLPVPGAAEPWRSGRPRDVGWAIAAALAARTATLRRLGPFDARAFLHYEDLDLCLRARAQGVPTELRPEVVLRHSGGHATHRGGEPLADQARRRREVVGANLGRGALLRDDAAQALTFASRALVRGRRSREAAQLGALLAARRG
jgi:GT2 family glycosyltransferase